MDVFIFGIHCYSKLYIHPVFQGIGLEEVAPFFGAFACEHSVPHVGNRAGLPGVEGGCTRCSPILLNFF